MSTSPISSEIAFHQLPSDTIQESVSYFDDLSLVRTASVCRGWYAEATMKAMRAPALVRRNLELEIAYCQREHFPRELQEIFTACRWSIRALPEFALTDRKKIEPSRVTQPVMKFRNGLQSGITFQLQGIADGEINYGNTWRIRDIQGLFTIYKYDYDNQNNHWLLWSYLCDTLIANTWIEKHNHVGDSIMNNDCCPMTSFRVKAFHLRNLLTGQDPFFRIVSQESLVLDKVTKTIADANLRPVLQ